MTPSAEIQQLVADAFGIVIVGSIASCFLYFVILGWLSVVARIEQHRADRHDMRNPKEQWPL